MAGMGIGASLASLGAMQQKEGTQMLAESARQEQERELENKRLMAQNKAEKRQLGGSVGAMAGFALGASEGGIGGPWGALIGGVVGAVAGGLFN